MNLFRNHTFMKKETTSQGSQHLFFVDEKHFWSASFFGREKKRA